MNVTFVHKELVHLLWAALGICGALAWLELRRGAELGRILSPRMQLRLCLRLSPQRRALRLVLLFLALSCGIAALMRPQGPGDLETISSGGLGGDVMVVLDTSRSMLAEDAAPSRLGRAKAELVDLLGKLGGNRVGLVAFAGRAQVLCPLTPDYGFFRTILDGVNTRSVSRGGTRIGDGLRAALAAFGQGGSSGGGARLILLITDGEDQGSYPLDAARAAKDAGVRVVSIGFGDERGSEITLVDPGTGARRFLTDRSGQVVRSRLDGKTLRDIALATGGAYVPAGVAALDLDAIVREHIQPLFRDQKEALQRTVPREHYPVLVLASLLCLVGSAWAGAGARRCGAAVAAGAVVLLLSGPARAQDGGALPSGRDQAAGAPGAPDARATPAPAQAPSGAAPGDKDPLAGQPPRRSYNQARAAYEAGDLAGAERGFLSARDGAGADDELRFRAAFNLGLTRARRADGLEKDKLEDAIHALEEGAAWFRDAVHQRPEDVDARANLELLLRRAQQLADRLNQGQNGLEARLQRVLQDQRTLRERVRGLLGKVSQAGGGTEPLAFQGEFDDSSAFQRTLLADAGAVLDLAGQEKDRIAGKPEAERSEQERVRTVQLQNLEIYLNEARGTMAEAGRLLRRLQGDRAHRQADLAVTQLKRALEQLLDPVTVLKGLSGDQAQVLAETQALHELQEDAQRVGQIGAGDTPKSSPKEAPPAWLTAPFLGTQQKDLQPRAQELVARLRAGVEHGTQPAPADAQAQGGAQSGQGTPPMSPAEQSPEDRKKQRVLQAAREALPRLEEASAAMERAAAALAASRLEEAGREQVQALNGLFQALERFSDVRDLIELIHGDQGQVVALLTPPKKGEAPKAPELSAKERTAALTEAVARNRERLARLAGLFSDELQALTQAEKAPAGEGQPQQPQQKEQIAAQKERYKQAEALRQKADAALSRLSGLLATPAGVPRAREPAQETLTHVEALRRLFFSIIEHLKDLHHKQTGTYDDTSTARADKDDEGRRRRLGPLAGAQGGHAALGKALAEALAAQADQAAQAGAADPAAAAGDPGQAQKTRQAQEAAKVLAQAADEVRKAHGAMALAHGQLKDDQTAPVSPDLEPVLGQQKEALAHLEQAIQLLQPPEQKQQQQKDQQQDQQLSQEQAARRLQAIREREAERQRDEKRRQPAEQEPVEKDW